jgi:hypothetical protein
VLVWFGLVRLDTRYGIMISFVVYWMCLDDGT